MKVLFVVSLTTNNKFASLQKIFLPHVSFRACQDVNVTLKNLFCNLNFSMETKALS